MRARTSHRSGVLGTTRQQLETSAETLPGEGFFRHLALELLAETCGTDEQPGVKALQ